MKFLIYGSKEEVQKLEKILNSLYSDCEFKNLASNPTASTVTKYHNQGYKVFRVGSKSGTSYSDKVLNVNFD